MSSAGMFERVDAAAAFIRRRCGGMPELALILGSGLGDFTSTLTGAVEMPYAELPNWPVSTVVGHPGLLVMGTCAGRHVAVLAGRAHAYEGLAPDAVTFTTRVLGRLGVKRIILTNAAGGVNTAFSRGTLMIIDDHINLLGANPLAGDNDDRFGPRFPDMSAPYDTPLRDAALAAARTLDCVAHQGVYAGFTGPSFETRAEYRMLRHLGADAVGMSTVPEVIVANHAAMRVLGLSVITNLCRPDCLDATGHEEVLEAADSASRKMTAIVEAVLAGEGTEG